jgi:propanol-preferring alcohol dehydrogenase
VSILREDQLPHPHIPIIPGHDIVGRVDALGDGVSGLTIGERVGIPWLAAVGFVE